MTRHRNKPPSLFDHALKLFIKGNQIKFLKLSILFELPIDFMIGKASKIFAHTPTNRLETTNDVKGKALKNRLKHNQFPTSTN